MGCCASRPDDGGTTPAIRAHSSSRNITAPSTRPASLQTPRASHISQSYAQPSGSRQDAIDRPNTPLKAIGMFQRAKLSDAPPNNASRGRVTPLSDSMNNITWTRSRLEKERNDWWDTQVTGSAEVWGAIRLASQSLQAGKLRDAQGWLEAMECTCPTGCLWKGVYDSTGVMYKVPEWLIVEPEGIVPEGTDVEATGDSVGGTGDDEAAQEADDDEDDEPVVVRARVSLNGRDLMLKLRRKEPIISIIEKIKAQAELDPSCSIRLVYGGRIYQDRETLESHSFWDFANDYVVTALVLE